MEGGAGPCLSLPRGLIMCRLLAYKGPPVVLDELLYKPEHSLIKQSHHAVEMEEPLNGDGFGIGWYNRKVDPDPAVFTSVRPAWNNRNLQYMAPKLTSGCVFAHVRAANVGGVSAQNCHPFHHRNFLMMHNGGIRNFKAIRRQLLAKLSDPQFHAIRGQTDSEHMFALYLEHLPDTSGMAKPGTLIDALRATVDDIIELKYAEGLNEDSRLNILITNGLQMVGCRLVTGSGSDPLSLYYARGGRYECRNNRYTLADNGGGQAVLLVSERLNEHAQAWETVPANHFFAIDKEGTIAFSEA